jgi:aminotransferase EvaB
MRRKVFLICANDQIQRVSTKNRRCLSRHFGRRYGGYANEEILLNIPLQNFTRHVAEFRSLIDERLKAVQDRAHFILGPEVEEFERRFAAYIGTRHCLAVANGTQAMELVLRGLDAEGAEVITTANAGMYATCAILSAGFKPVYCEIDPVLTTPDPESLRQAITPRTKAVIATHLYGQAADMEAITAICRAAGVELFEDCAEAHGAKIGPRKVGSFGRAGCFSFYPTKNLGAYGDGGAITTDDDEFAVRLRSLRQYGWSRKYRAGQPHGTNSRMDEMQAAVLNAKLDRLDEMNDRRRRIVSRYNAALAGKAPRLPFTANDNFIVHHYVLRSSRREEIMRELGKQGIATDVHFPVPDYLQQALAGRVPVIRLPETERACREVFTIPSFPEMTQEEIDTVSRVIAEVYEP